MNDRSIYTGRPPTEPGIADDGVTVLAAKSCQIRQNSVSSFS